MGIFDGVLLISDYDRTLTGTDPGHTVPERNLEAIARFVAEGGRFSVATGRGRIAFKHEGLLKLMNAPGIFSNGALVYDGAADTVEEMLPLPEEAAPIIRAFRDTYAGRAGLEIYTTDRCYVFGSVAATERHMRLINIKTHEAPFDEVPKPWLKAVFSAETEILEEICAAINSRHGHVLTAAISLPFLMEVQPRGVDKGRAVRRLHERLGTRRLICVGDAQNDVTLLAAADVAFVPEDGDPELLEKYSGCAPCDEGAVADVIEKLESRFRSL
ncbi:HAD-IIB family hydrolase [Oscillospiraceae bacterium OttesenSCG-928-F05]|nr:HAD-IIB family hydrolase [Oscillospiraceae bacterium OttesenSCG-928-F05]